MKKALVYIKEFEGRTVGQVSMIMEAAEMDKWSHHHVSSGMAIKVEVPVECESLPENQLAGVLIPTQAESWNDGTNTVYVEPADLTGWTYQAMIPEHYEIQKGAGFVAYDKQIRIGDKFKTLNDEVLAEMQQVYATTNPESATANYLTWLAMKSNALSFAGAGLVARFDVVGFTIGDALDTDAKVLDYATKCLAIADNYAIFREQKILLFVSEKAAIEAE